MYVVEIALILIHALHIFAEIALIKRLIEEEGEEAVIWLLETAV
jgi:hypothetical protein